jgi:hypothetical protein
MIACFGEEQYTLTNSGRSFNHQMCRPMPRSINTQLMAANAAVVN